MRRWANRRRSTGQVARSGRSLPSTTQGAAESSDVLARKTLNSHPAANAGPNGMVPSLRTRTFTTRAAAAWRSSAARMPTAAACQLNQPRLRVTAPASATSPRPSWPGNAKATISIATAQMAPAATARRSESGLPLRAAARVKHPMLAIAIVPVMACGSRWCRKSMTARPIDRTAKIQNAGSAGDSGSHPTTTPAAPVKSEIVPTAASRAGSPSHHRPSTRRAPWAGAANAIAAMGIPASAPTTKPHAARAFTGLPVALAAAFAAVFSPPAFEFGKQVDEFGAGDSETVVGGIRLLVVLDQPLFLEVGECAGQGAGVDDLRAGPRYDMMQPGVPERSFSQGGQDGLVQFAFCDAVNGIEVVQRGSPPPISARERAVTLSGFANVLPGVCDRRDRRVHIDRRAPAAPIAPG
jgi:hypothetical protein